MGASSVLLTVRSINNGVLASAIQMNFVVDRMTIMMANQNALTTPTVTEAGDTANQLSAWEIYGANASTLGWELTNVSSDRTVKLFSDTYHTNCVATGTRTGDGVLMLYPVGDSRVSGKVTIAYSADDVDHANTVTVANFVATKDLQLPGVTQFTYEEADGRKVKYTVDETVSAIALAINGDAGVMEATVNLTSAQILALNTTPIEIVAAPGAGYYIEVVSGVVALDATATGYAANDDIDLVYSSAPTVKCATADGALAGTSDKNTSIIKIAGAVIANNALQITDVDGNPTTGTGTAKVTVAYRIVAI